MKWFGLYNKIGKQSIKITQKSDVVAIINGKEIPLLLRFKKDGSPYLIEKEEYEYWNTVHNEKIKSRPRTKEEK